MTPTEPITPASSISPPPTATDLALPVDAAPAVTFEQLGLSETLVAALTAMGFSAPTAVQVQTVPLALAGRDLLVQSRTGSGKTAAFAIPLVEKLVDVERREPQALILAPTRELAMQVHRECARVAAVKGTACVAIYGGAALPPQARLLAEGAQIIIGTPGRVLDHLRRGTLSPRALRTLVLDECDEMLSMGFQEELNAILERLPRERQTLLFSATIPGEIQRLIDRYLKDPERLYLSQDFVGVREIHHVCYQISGGGRSEDLLRVLDYERPHTALIFCNTRDETARLAHFLSQRGLRAEGISSDLGQGEREQVMTRMRAGQVQYLVATDVAARGIDLPELSHVINYDFPESADIYVHRTGRTGRAGRSGIAVSLVSPREVGSLYYVKLIHKITPEQRHLPSAEELASRREGEQLMRLRARYREQATAPALQSLLRRIQASEDGEQLLAQLLGAALAASDPPPAAALQRDPTGAETERPRRRGGRHAGPRVDPDRPVTAPAEPRVAAPAAPAPAAPAAVAVAASAAAPSAVAPRGDDPGEQPRRRRRFGGSAEAGPVPGPGRAEGARRESVTTSDGEVEYFDTFDLSDTTASVAPAALVPPATADMTRVFVNVGRQHGVRVEDLTSFVQIEAGLHADEIGPVTQQDRHSHLLLNERVVDQTVVALSGKLFGEQTLRVERARALEGSANRGRGRRPRR
ncbi:MAG: DEAD/DEAH box helicase [Proteobacteria bacterium]|nr:DEAD/DEAH box helicase [Pseudomonadota bacterium]